jgi:hypothetical protein
MWNLSIEVGEGASERSISKEYGSFADAAKALSGIASRIIPEKDVPVLMGTLEKGPVKGKFWIFASYTPRYRFLITEGHD